MCVMLVTNVDVQERAEELEAKAEKKRAEIAEAKVFIFWLGVFALVARLLK